MFMYLYLSRHGVYDRLLGIQTHSQSLRLKQKDLMEFGSVTMLVGAVSLTLTVSVWFGFVYVVFALFFMANAYLTMTLSRYREVFLWVGKDTSCVIYILMVYSSSLGGQVIA